MLFDWFKILKNLEKKKGKNDAEIYEILCKYLIPVLKMESEGTVLQCASNYMKENTLSLLSQLIEDVSTKLESDILVKLD